MTNETLPEVCTLRYTVETKRSPTFTASKKISFSESESAVSKLKQKNEKMRRVQYSNFKLYDMANNLIKQWTE